MQKLNFKFYKPRNTGLEAFENDFQGTVVVFEVTKGVFQHWNPQPFEVFAEQWDEGIPFDYTEEELEEYGYDLDNLAIQLNIYAAWGLDL